MKSQVECVLWGVGGFAQLLAGHLSDAGFSVRGFINPDEEAVRQQDIYCLDDITSDPSRFQGCVLVYAMFPAHGDPAQSDMVPIIPHEYALKFIETLKEVRETHGISLRMLHPCAFSDVFDFTVNDRAYVAGNPGSGNTILQTLLQHLIVNLPRDDHDDASAPDRRNQVLSSLVEQMC